VFVGGFTRDAAEAVAGADLGTLSQLSQLALIQRLPDPYGPDLAESPPGDDGSWRSVRRGEWYEVELLKVANPLPPSSH
jgi:hypothetical protein